MKDIQGLHQTFLWLQNHPNKYHQIETMRSFKRINVLHMQPALSFMELERLFQHLLDQLTNSKDTFFILSQASNRFHKIMHQKGIEYAENELLKDYCSSSFQNQIILFKKENPDFILFTPMTFRLIHHLLIHKIDFHPKLNLSNQVSSSPVKTLDSRPENINNFCLLGACLVANRILDHVEDSLRKLDPATRDIRTFYFRCLTDPVSAISRASMYENDHFNNKLKAIYGISAKQLIDPIFGYFSHVLSEDPAIIHAELSLNNFLEVEKKEVAQTALNLLSQKHSRIPITLHALIQSLCDDLYLDRCVRGKPFIQVNELYYCLRPDLLDNALGDLPYHLIFTHLLTKNKNNSKDLERNDFKSKRGEAYQEYLFGTTQSVLGKEVCRNENYKKSGEFGDMIIQLSPTKLLIAEIKLADPQDSLKQGDIEELKKRFLIPQKRNRILNDTHDPLQLMHRASEYRKKIDFKETIQTIMIYHGWFPELDIFDDLYTKLIKGHETCIQYDSIQNNSPLILMNGFTWELILSSIKQKFKNESADKITTLNSIVEFICKDANLPSKTLTNNVSCK